MRRSTIALNYWAAYTFAGPSPKVDGPPPQDAPQNFNSTKTETSLDPAEDSFPTSIRGRLNYPDVPLDQLTPMWYVCEQTDFGTGELKSWVASAPPNAYRFRPFDEFDSAGRKFVQEMKAYNHRAAEGFQFREASLTKMSGAVTPKVSLATLMDRAIQSKVKGQPIKSTLAVQRDVGRTEPIPPVAGAIPVDASVFPFKWNTDDWYEYEVAKVRNRRFKMENSDSINGSEVTYRLVIEAQWDMHALRMADDVCDFIRDIGRQVIEERLVTLRRHLESIRNGGPLDSELVNSTPGYSEEEIRQQCELELSAIEQQCITILSKTAGQVSDRYDVNKSWPVIENLEPWKRMAEYWAAYGDKHWTHMEMSTRKVEFRKFYRVITVKMPFVSLELEKRLYDIRHWAHRNCTIEYQTIYRRNVIHDTSMFPVEHDPITPMSEENHRAFSFALDWEEAPARQASVELARAGDTFEIIATRLGTSIEALKQANPGVSDVTPGVSLNVPLGSSKAVTSFGHSKASISLTKDGKRIYNSWEEIAAAIGCDATELQEMNQDCCDADGKLVPNADVVYVPMDMVTNSLENEFASSEVVGVGDTWTGIAKRLGTTAKALRQANPTVSSLVAGGTIAIPSGATNVRRISDPLLSVDAADVATSRLRAEMKTFNLEQGIPTAPEGADKFKFEFMDSSTRYPMTPQQLPGTDDWLSYTAAYLDPALNNAAEAKPLYNVNQLWPMMQVPGKVDQTPFEEDQTWMMHHIPLQRQEMFHAEGYLQDLPNVNHEVFPRSLEWQSP